MSRCIYLLFCAAAVFTSASADPEVEVALAGDDQCVSAECSFNALQVRSLKSASEELEDDSTDSADSQLSELQNSDAEEAFADEEEEVEGESEWLKDISIHAKNLLKHKLTPLQKPIVELYKNYSVLDKAADKALWELGNITGEPVVWNRKALLQDDAEEEEMEFSSSGRRRSSRDLPPRARYVNKILIYLDKEMKAVWNLHTIVDRKRWGLDNIVTSNPEGPGSASLAQEESAEEPKITNKYEEHLYEDYHALLKNIKDAGEKLEELKISLANSTANMHAWAKI